MQKSGEENLNKISQKFINLTAKYELNPRWLAKILYLNSLGLSQEDIANRMGIHRLTVNRYILVLKRMPEYDARNLIFWGIDLFRKSINYK